jgi:hypothetical protein
MTDRPLKGFGEYPVAFRCGLNMTIPSIRVKKKSTTATPVPGSQGGFPGVIPAVHLPEERVGSGDCPGIPARSLSLPKNRLDGLNRSRQTMKEEVL